MTPSSRQCVSQRLLHRALPYGLALGVGLFLFGSFGFGASLAHAPALLVLWFSLILATDSRLCRNLQFALPRIGRQTLWRSSLGACIGLALAWWLAGWPVGPALVVLHIVLFGMMLRRFSCAGLRSERQVKSEGLRLALLLGGSLILIHPYASPRLVGAGDAEHYARQMADVIVQMRSGVFPVYIGQSLSAFEGSVHPLRTSPGLPYAGGLLDLLTGRQLAPVALQNLLIVLCLVAAVIGCYAALNRAVANRRWECTWLALLFGTSPGVLALLYAGDMFASWTALPWLPWLFLGWVLTWQQPQRPAGSVLQAIALAMLWLTHAPIALWSSLLTLLAELVRWTANGFNRRILLTQVGAVMLCLLLCHYVLVSVMMLDVPANPYLGFDLAKGAVFQSVKESWSGLWRMVSTNGGDLAHDLHLSPGLLVVAFVGIATASRTRGPVVVLGLTAALLIGLLLPWTGVTDRFWNAMPVYVMTVSEKWPVQRFYPLLSALLPFLGALALTHPFLARPNLRHGLLVALAVSVGWSAWEARKFLAHGTEVTRSTAATERFLLPENNTLSRYSYEMWGQLPDFFSFGYMDPEMQCRLIDPLTGVVQLSNVRALPAKGGEAARHRFVPDAVGGRFEPAITLQPEGACFVTFDFQGRDPEGTLLVEGRRLARRYELPVSGGIRAFGALPGQNQGFTLQNDGPESEEVVIRFVRRNAGSALLGPATVIPYEEAVLPIRLRSLFPYSVEVTTENGGWIETPKILIAGYRATVNGQIVEPARSPSGLLMVRVPAGAAQVTIEYHAPPPLAFSFWLNATALTVLVAMLISWLGAGRFAVQRFSPVGNHNLLLHLGRAGLVLASCAVLGLGLVQAAAVMKPAVQTDGHYRFQLMLPVGKHEIYETLLSWRDGQGKTSSIVIFYESDRFIRIGCRKDNVLKVLTDALPANYFVPHDVEIVIGPDLREEERRHLPPMSDEDWQRKRQTIAVTFNGHPIWETPSIHQHGTELVFAIGREIQPGTDGVGAFRGRIIEQPPAPLLSAR